ncbi:MAG: RNA-binding S4 domain-containing protein [Trueperaceae bacterium]|nr:RNA-binding S4 domain-containing protein [Trueperaceae bacterium]
MAPNETDPRAERDDDVLRLDHALKLAGVAATGGQAKQLIQGGSVRVNGEVETRRKRKLVEGDVVEVGDESFEIALSDEDEDGDEGDRGDAPDDAGVVAAGEDADGGWADADGPERDAPVVPTAGTAAREPAAAASTSAADLDDLGDLGEDDLELTPDDLARWAAWVIDRMAEDDGEAVILRLGSLHPDALEALFGRLPTDVEDAVLDALDEVLECSEQDVFGDGSQRDGPMEA